MSLTAVSPESIDSKSTTSVPTLLNRWSLASTYTSTRSSTRSSTRTSTRSSTRTSTPEYVTHTLDPSFLKTVERKTPELPSSIPVLRESCKLQWGIGKKLGSGAGAVIFELTPTDKIARVTQLTQENQNQFYNDIKVRRHIDRISKDPATQFTTRLLDSTICTADSKLRFGITVSKRYTADLESYLRTIPSKEQKREIIEKLKKDLPQLVEELWATYHVFHRDIHAKNILVASSDDEINFILTDFEKAEYIPLNDLINLSKKDFSTLKPQEKSLLSDILFKDQSTLFDRYGMDKQDLQKFTDLVGDDFKWEKVKKDDKTTYPNNEAISIWCRCTLACTKRMIGLFEWEAKHQVEMLIKELDSLL